MTDAPATPPEHVRLVTHEELYGLSERDQFNPPEAP